ncbi:MAG: prepilin peptidase [Sphingorhabdus sp.]
MLEAALAGLPSWFLIGGAAILGATWGSFAAALCDRWPNDKSVTKGRSHCNHCGHIIRARDLIPLLSFLVLRGRCRDCHEAIGARAIIIEIMSLLLGAVPFVLLPPGQAAAAAILGWLLLPLITLDLLHYWLPDRLTIILAMAGLAMGGILTPDISITDQAIGAVTGYGILELIRRLYRALRHREGMGAGDPKLFGALGFWFGWQALPMLMMLASGVGLIWAFGGRRKNTGLRLLPLGAYLGISAILLAWFSSTLEPFISERLPVAGIEA